jgi:hypothetical protein
MTNVFGLSTLSIQQYFNAAAEVVDASNENVRKVFRELEDLSLATTTYMIKQQQSQAPANSSRAFPAAFVTIPQTEHVMGNSRRQSGAYVMGYVPTVRSDQFDRWTAYALDNSDWIAESWSTYQQEQPNTTALSNANVSIGDGEVLFQIWETEFLDKDGNEVTIDTTTCDNHEGGRSVQRGRSVQVLTDPRNGLASPVWTVTPPPHPNEVARTINFNMRSDQVFQDAVSIVEESRKPTLHDICSSTSVSHCS